MEDINQKDIEEFTNMMVKIKKVRDEIDNDPEFLAMIIGKPKEDKPDE
jgi:hypothetical protein